MNTKELFKRYATFSKGIISTDSPLEQDLLMSFDGFNKAVGEIISLPVEAQVKQAACGYCRYFNLFRSSEYDEGACQYRVKFPDSRFARAEGMKKNMRGTDGKNCPCFESKPPV